MGSQQRLRRGGMALTLGKVQEFARQRAKGAASLPSALGERKRRWRDGGRKGGGRTSTRRSVPSASSTAASDPHNSLPGVRLLLFPFEG